MTVRNKIRTDDQQAHRSDDVTVDDDTSDPEERDYDCLKSALLAAEDSLDGNAGYQLVKRPTEATSAELYESISARDGIEAMMAESTIAMFDVAQDSVQRAMEAKDGSVREQNLKIAMQANTTMVKFAKAIRDHRRFQQPKRLSQTFSIKM